jgi:hypothetical protein
VHRQGQIRSVLRVGGEGLHRHHRPLGFRWSVRAVRQGVARYFYDGHTFHDVIEDTERLTCCMIERAYVDEGYRGCNAQNARHVFISGQKRGVFCVINRELRRRLTTRSGTFSILLGMCHLLPVTGPSSTQGATRPSAAPVADDGCGLPMSRAGQIQQPSPHAAQRGAAFAARGGVNAVSLAVELSPANRRGRAHFKSLRCHREDPAQNLLNNRVRSLECAATIASLRIKDHMDSRQTPRWKRHSITLDSTQLPDALGR